MWTEIAKNVRDLFVSQEIRRCGKADGALVPDGWRWIEIHRDNQWPRLIINNVTDLVYYASSAEDTGACFVSGSSAVLCMDYYENKACPMPGARTHTVTMPIEWDDWCAPMAAEILGAIGKDLGLAKLRALVAKCSLAITGAAAIEAALDDIECTEVVKCRRSREGTMFQTAASVRAGDLPQAMEVALSLCGERVAFTIPLFATVVNKEVKITLVDNGTAGKARSDAVNAIYAEIDRRLPCPCYRGWMVS